MKEKLRSMYLNWANNFLSYPKFADHYGISEEKAKRVVYIGRLLHEQTIRRDFYKEFYANRKQQISDEFNKQHTGF
jgi:hypothetical protein